MSLYSPKLKGAARGFITRRETRGICAADAPPPGPAVRARLSFIFPLPPYFLSAQLPIRHTASSSSLEHSDKAHTPKETLTPLPSPSPTPFPSDVGNEAEQLQQLLQLLQQDLLLLSSRSEVPGEAYIHVCVID
jgi:hypothetical protein